MNFIFKFFILQSKKIYTIKLIFALKFSLLRHDISFQRKKIYTLKLIVALNLSLFYVMVFAFKVFFLPSLMLISIQGM